MNKAIRILLLVSLLFTMSVVAVNAAGPTGTYGSGITCVNLDSAAGTFVITFYKADGSQAGQISDSITAQGVKLYFTPNIAALPASFLGAAVVSSDVQLACSVNTQTTSGLLRVGTSNGVPSTKAGSPLYVPQIASALGGTWNTYVAVQNTTSAAATVNATYYTNTGTVQKTFSQSIPANSSFVFYQDNGDLPAGFVGSAKFESTAALAGTVALFNSGADAGSAQFLSYNAFTSGATKIFGPRLVKNLSNVGFTSGFTCQNVGANPINITADITMVDQGAGNVPKTVQLSKTGLAKDVSWGPYMGSVTELAGISAGIGGVVINATGPVACIFNEDNRTTYAGLGSTYSGIADGEQSNTMSFPQIVSLGASSYQGGFQFQNTTATPTTCTYTFSNGDVVSSQALAANESKSVFAPNVLVNNKTNFNGSVVVTCGQPIVGIYNLAALTTLGDSFATNNGINR